MVSSVSLILLLYVSLLPSTYFHFTQAGGGGGSSQSIASGLSWNFYRDSCPELEPMVRKHLKKELEKDTAMRLLPSLIHLHFKDCFATVSGCDGSILLNGSGITPSEKDAQVVDDIRNRVQQKCGPVVSCADILALSARDAVYLSGGPYYDIPLGRRDGLKIASVAETLANLPPPSSETTTILNSFATKGFTTTDTVALLGAHTIGISHCSSFADRLYPSQDPTMDRIFAKKLRKTCPTPDSNNTAALDIRTPYTFDNKYYVNLVNGQGLLTADQDLFADPRTRGIVSGFAVDEDLFYSKFVNAFVKMSQLNVLTGDEGEIRQNCALTNSESESLSSMAVKTSENLSAF